MQTPTEQSIKGRYIACTQIFVVLPIAELANLLLLIVCFQTSGSSLAIIKLLSKLLITISCSVYNFFIGVHGTELREFTVPETKLPNIFMYQQKALV